MGLLIVLALANHASATTIVIGSGRDTTIYGNAVTNSNGSGVQMVTGNASTSQPRRGLVRFDLASVPSGATITSATLTMQLVVSASSGPATTNVLLYRLLDNWGEAGSTASTGMGSGTGTAALTGDATWNRRFFDDLAQSWTTPGGDFFSTESATMSINKTNGPKVWSSAGMVLDAQLWLDNPAQNFGWLVGPAPSNTTTQTERRFGTREAGEALMPVLTIEYTEAVAVPEPTTLTLVATGLALLGLAGARYRHRSRAEV